MDSFLVQLNFSDVMWKPTINTVYIKETPCDRMTLENQESFPVLLKIVNLSNLVLKAFSDNIELSLVKLRPRLKKKQTNKQTTSTLHSFFFLYTLKYYHSNLWSGMKYPKWRKWTVCSRACVILSPQSIVLGAFVLPRFWFARPGAATWVVSRSF